MNISSDYIADARDGKAVVHGRRDPSATAKPPRWRANVILSRMVEGIARMPSRVYHEDVSRTIWLIGTKVFFDVVANYVPIPKLSSKTSG
jgi:hypothetical protein